MEPITMGRSCTIRRPERLAGVVFASLLGRDLRTHQWDQCSRASRIMLAIWLRLRSDWHWTCTLIHLWLSIIQRYTHR